MKDDKEPVGDGASPASHWKDMAALSQYAAIESPTQAIEEAVATLGCHVPIETIRRHLADRGQELDPALIEKVIGELKRQASGSNPCT
jgi:hypothetical protein